MKFRRLSIQIAALCIAAFSVAAYSQAGNDRLNAPTTDGSPTLKVTSDWLAQTLQAYGGGHGDDVYSNIGIDNNCTFSFTDKYTYTDVPGEVGDYYFTTVSIRLGTVDKIIVNGGTPGVYITTGQVAGVHIVISSPMKANGKRNPNNPPVGEPESDTNSQLVVVMRTPPTVAGADLPQSPDQIIPRITSALQHAVALCAGSYTPPAQSNQPF
jgi:hypothetical protein